MAEDKELRETIYAAFACYDEDNSGWIDATELRHLVADLGGVLTERDFSKALHILDRDNNGVIDKDEFAAWWAGQSEDNEAFGEVEKTLARLKDLGRQRFKVDIHTACWNGFTDVVARLVEEGSELVNQKDSSDYGVSLLQCISRAHRCLRDPHKAWSHNKLSKWIWMHTSIFCCSARALGGS